MNKISHLTVLLLLLFLATGEALAAPAAAMHKKEKTLVILIHGFCKGADDMQFWKKALAPEFTDVITPDLPTTFSSFETCLKELTDTINAAKPHQYDHIYIAGHSMGGLLAREYLHKHRPANVRKLICVGTPHFGSKLADIALYFPGAGWIWKPLHALKCSARTKLTTPDIPNLEIAVITSTNNGHWPGKLFLSDQADGLVDLTSAHAPDAKHVTSTAANHVKMQYDPETAALIKKFFIHGKF
ncbi:MAG: alpha/beta fold hydrolase [Lentisphaeria bacterium]|nr:alpha/beta fold hydrolase [Lentisphaeria bacterium]